MPCLLWQLTVGVLQRTESLAPDNSDCLQHLQHSLPMISGKCLEFRTEGLNLGRVADADMAPTRCQQKHSTFLAMQAQIVPALCPATLDWACKGHGSCHYPDHSSWQTYTVSAGSAV